jgi:uncharacterized protein YjiS (DUF1127 family)
VGCGSFRIDAFKEPAMLFSTLMEIYRDWRRYNAGLSELSSLSDRELADIGISRADIYRVAWEKACRPPEPAAFATNARQMAGVCGHHRSHQSP